MKTKPETIHWDLSKHNNANTGSTMSMPTANNGVIADDLEPCDAQFWTPRLPAWKELLKAAYPTANWHTIEHGEQMRIADCLILNLYDSGKVMAQGPCFKIWAQTEFTQLTNKLDNSSTLSRQDHTSTDALPSSNPRAGITISQTLPKAVHSTQCTPTANSPSIPCTPATPSTNNQQQTTPLRRLLSKVSRLLMPGHRTTPQAIDQPHPLNPTDSTFTENQGSDSISDSDSDISFHLDDYSNTSQSLLLEPITPEGTLSPDIKNEVSSLQNKLTDTVESLEHERQTLLQLKHNMKIMDHRLAEKEDKTNCLEKTVKSKDHQTGSDQTPKGLLQEQKTK